MLPVMPLGKRSFPKWQQQQKKEKAKSFYSNNSPENDQEADAVLFGR